MRTVTAHRSWAPRLGSKVRALVAVATAVVGVSAGLVFATASVAGAVVTLGWAQLPVSGTVAGAKQSPAIEVSGATSGDTVTLSLSGGPANPVYFNATVTANAGGDATFTNFYINTAGTYTVTATDSTANATEAVTGISIVAGTPQKLLFTTEPPSAVISGGTFGATVTVTDSYNNAVSGLNDTIVLSTSTGGCALGGTTTATGVTSAAVFSGITLTGASNLNCVLTATDSTTPYTPATSTTISVVGAPAKLAFTTSPPATATYGVTFGSVAVAVEDANGTIESASGGTGNADSITLTSPNCTVTAASLNVAASNGVATFSNVMFTGSVTTNCTLVATDATHPLSVSSLGTLTSTNSPAKLGFSVQPPTTSAAGAVMAAFQVSTESGNGTVQTVGSNTSDTVTISSTCTLYGTTTAAEVNGTATFSNVSFQKAGSCTIVATDATAPAIIAAATSTAITVTAGTPTHLVFTTAPPTTFGSLSTPLTAFAVSVEDAYGNVASTSVGSTDTVTITSSNCTLTGVTSVAATGGVASFSDVIITTPGTCILAAADASRVLTGATATVTVGQPQPTLVVSSTTGYFKTPLKLTTTGGAGTGAVTYTVVSGTAKGCAIVNGNLTTTSQGTCLVTATKAASGTYALATSAATTVTIGAQLLKAYRVIGPVYMGHRMVIRVSGVGFYGAPRVISNTAGFTARVAHDSGTLLTIIITSSPRNRAGVHVLVVIEPNGRRASLRFTLLP